MSDSNTETMILVIRDLELRYGLNTALAEAARWDLLTEVERLLQAGADVNSRIPPNHATPLMYANTPRIAKLLLQHGADPNAVSGDGRTPLIAFLYGLYTRRQAIRYIETLLQLGADPTIVSRDGESPIELARAKYGDSVAAILENHVTG